MTEWDKFVKIEEKASMDEEDEGMHGHNLYSIIFCDTNVPRRGFDRPSNTTTRVLRILGTIDFYIFFDRSPTNIIFLVCVPKFLSTVPALISRLVFLDRWVHWYQSH
jgi:hypothetical protein